MNINQLFSISRSGLNGLQKALDTTADNIANTNTVGFKEQDTSFHELIHQNVTDNEVAQTATPKSTPLGMNTSVESTVFNQGIFQTTNRTLDLAIDGNSFFGVTAPSGQTYLTKAGNFYQDEQGQLVSAEGWPVAMEETIPHAQWPKGELTIGPQGNVQVRTNQELVTVGRIGMFQVADTQQLARVGQTYFEAMPGSQVQSSLAQEGDFGTIKQGVLEGSTVNLAQSMTDLIVIQRSYGLNTRAVQTADEMWQATNRFTE